MKGELNLARIIIPIEGVFHFVAIIVVVEIGNYFWFINVNVMLTENFSNQFGFELKLVIVFYYLPRGC